MFLLCFFYLKTFYNSFMISGTLVKILSIVLLMVVAVVLILGIGTLFKGGETSKKYSNKLMQYRVLFQFIAIIVLVCFAYFFKN
ncbi:twin transmembrane helix small protein [Candidatus Pelagibacter sp.]|nr:twin transmembrane helix small protein [Candidatus Pelagibacter sp.]